MENKIAELYEEARFYRKKFQDNFGVNQREEIVRLLFEIARREDLTLKKIYEEIVQDFEQESTNLSYKNLKTVLLRRRYPNLTDEEKSNIQLVRLKEFSEKKMRFDPTHFKLKKIHIEKKALDFPLARRVQDLFPDVPVEIVKSAKDLRRPAKQWIGSFGKDEILLSAEKFDFLKQCPCSPNSLGCNYYILNLGFGCPYDCSYCYLQFYQNIPAIILFVNPEQFLKELDEFFAGGKLSWTRIGTGEFTDSLALDWLSEYSKVLVPYFKDKNVFFELKTKSNQIDNLLDLDHGGKTVVSWSLNPPLYEREELGAATVNERISAARECQKAGYPVAFHFDPIIYTSNWEELYQKLVQQLFDGLIQGPKWISLGAFRYHRDLKKTSEFRHPETSIFLGEQSQDEQDEKIRYPKRIRVELYKKMLGWIRSRDSQVPVYLCMESLEVWKEVYGELPYLGKIDKWIASRPIRDER